MQIISTNYYQGCIQSQASKILKIYLHDIKAMYKKQKKTYFEHSFACKIILLSKSNFFFLTFDRRNETKKKEEKEKKEKKEEKKKER